MAEKDIMSDLNFKQRICFVCWGMRRRMKYFDLLHEGMAQRPAFERTRKLLKRELK